MSAAINLVTGVIDLIDTCLTESGCPLSREQRDVLREASDELAKAAA